MAIFLRFLACLAVFLTCQAAQAQPADTIITESGLKYVIEKPGSGPFVKKGDKVWVAYEGRFLNGKIFDTSELNGEPIKIKLGKDRIIKGWEEMLYLMQKGQKVTVVIPPDLAYGNRSIPNPDQEGDVLIPPGSTLIFEMEVVQLK